MLDLFFRVLLQTGSSEQAYSAVAAEITKRRLGMDAGTMSYEEACRLFGRVEDVSARLERMESVFGE